MFTVRPYQSDPSVLIHFEGSKMSDGYPVSYPVSVEMADSRVLINKGPFVDPEGRLTSLRPEEAGALVLTSVGFNTPELRERLDIWFDSRDNWLESMHRKLGVSGRRTNPAAVAAAFEKKVYVPDKPPRLTLIRESRREKFFNLAAQLATGESSEVGESEHLIAEDMGLGYVKQPGAVLVMLAGAGKALPSWGLGRTPSASYPKNLHLSPDPKEKTQDILYKPAESNPSIAFTFGGQPLDRAEPDMRIGYIKQVRICGAVIEVHDATFVNYEGAKKRLAPREMAALLLKCVLKTKEVEALTGTSGGARQGQEYHGPLLRVYDELLPPSASRKREWSAARSVRAAFQQRLLISRHPPNISTLENRLQERLYSFGDSFAQGEGCAQAGEKLGIAPATVYLNLLQIRRALSITTGGLVLISEAQKWYEPPAAS